MEEEEKKKKRGKYSPSKKILRSKNVKGGVSERQGRRKE